MTAHFKIDKDIPLPEENRGNRQTRYPFRDMEIGDSVFFPGMTAARAASATAYSRTKFSHKYAQRAVTENGVKGIRIWRKA